MTVYQIIILAISCILTYLFITDDVGYIVFAVVFWVWFANIYPAVEKQVKESKQIRVEDTFVPPQVNEQLKWEEP